MGPGGIGVSKTGLPWAHPFASSPRSLVATTRASSWEETYGSRKYFTARTGYCR